MSTPKPLSVEQWKNIGTGEFSACLPEMEATVEALDAAKKRIAELEALGAWSESGTPLVTFKPEDET